MLELENKVDIVAELSVLLRMTRRGEGMQLVYKQKPDGEEYVEIYSGGRRYRSINVSADSGIALIRDVIKDL